ncbi:MAG TPA: hypothetical protein VIL88_14760 [Devosia sp.]|jgi:hypothetical protein|uniref:hypothetical protein n=1 Tax=Devosia sp. TaxID=1871048 RepID=UPI002F93B70B
MTRAEAAAYCGYKPSAFSAHVAAGKLPKPLVGLHRWDRKVLDAFLDKASGIDPPEGEDAFTQWEREYRAGKEGEK